MAEMGRATDFPIVRGDVLAWLTAAEMREVDRIVTEELGIALLMMMENAGRALADLAIARYRPRTATVLAGRGGNGGGGMSAARHLANRGVAVTLVLAVERDSLADVPRRQLEVAERLGVPVSGRPVPGDVVVDALLGYSGRGDPAGRLADLIAWANAADGRIVSLDLPSGLDATTGVIGTPCVTASATLTLAMPKAGLRGRPDLVGELYLADISVPPVVYERLGVASDLPFRDGAIVAVV